jgi:Rieske Fe-S protein
MAATFVRKGLQIEDSLLNRMGLIIPTGARAGKGASGALFVFTTLTVAEAKKPAKEGQIPIQDGHRKGKIK